MNSGIIPGTAVAIDGHAILLAGTSGSGKSDLALRLIDRGATLVSDDMVSFEQSDGKIWLSAAPNIEGKLEVRNIGIIDLPCCEAELVMLVATDKTVERYPLKEDMREIAGQIFPQISIRPLEASAPLKVEIALRRLLENEPHYV